MNLDEILDELSKKRFADSDDMDPESFFYMIKEYYIKNDRHKYSEISKVVYEFKDESIDILRINLKEIKKLVNENDNDNLKLHNKIDKLEDHANLAGYQRTLIENMGKETNFLIKNYQDQLSKTRTELEDARSELKKTKEQFETVNEDLKEAQAQFDKENVNLKETQASTVTYFDSVSKKVQELEKGTSNIYTQFVTILGIFSSIIFAAFGGFQILQNTFGNIANVRVGKLITFSSLVMIGIVILLLILLNGISKISRTNVRSCGCKKDETCTHNSVQKYPIFYVSLLCLFYFFTIGISTFVFDYQLLAKQLNENVHIWGQVIIVAAIIIVIPIAMIVTFNVLKKRERADK